MPTIKTITDKINSHIIDSSDRAAVDRILRSGFLSKPDGGPAVVELQTVMGKVHNQKYAFAVNSGTSALHCAVSALELKEGDEVIIPALANIADYSVIIQENGTPIIADINPDSFNIDPSSIESKITEKTRAVIVVHMYGEPVAVEAIRDICDRHGLILIEDCGAAT